MRFAATTLGAVAAASLWLSACATGPLANAHMTSERMETQAELLYQATATSLDGLVTAGKLAPAQRDADKLAAWRALALVRTAYNAGSLITATSLDALRNDASSAGVPASVLNQSK